MTEVFDAESFVSNQIKAIKDVIGEEKALVAVSGGVDSTTSAVLTKKAIGDNLVCVILDDAFMRIGEPERVREVLLKPPLNLQVEVIDVRKRFLSALSGVKDAEEKRKAFRETFYDTLAEIARERGCKYLVQGTILADIIETKGGIKTQHNVLEQIGIRTDEKYGFKIVEPLASLLKWQVREVARYLNIPKEVVERQPFPGPGLSVRVLGEVTEEKLEVVKRATLIVEDEIAPFTSSQYFPVVIDNVEEKDVEVYAKATHILSEVCGLPRDSFSLKLFRDRGTGVKENKRVYGRILGIKFLSKDGGLTLKDVEDLFPLQAELTMKIPSITRILYAVGSREQNKPYVIAVRSVETRDFLTAKVSILPKILLSRIADKIMTACEEVSEVYYDVTPKPPATIEME